MNNLIGELKTNSIFDYQECIIEKVFVETTVDTDKDGKLDLVSVLIKRPKETLNGLKVPVLYVASPYLRKCNEDWYVPHNVEVELSSYESENINFDEIVYNFSENFTPSFTNHRETNGFSNNFIKEMPETEGIIDVHSYFNSRGYASVFCGGLGTRESEGLTITGSREEVLAFKAVIDWLNGNARGFTDKESNIEVKADWCTGKVAMTGKSYLGTMCIAVATTGVEGLETIIPEAAISNWYEYYRYNGLVLPGLGWQGDDIDVLSKYCFSRAKDKEDYKNIKLHYSKNLSKMLKDQNRDNGNYNKFWDERNYLNIVSKMRASVLLIHGINDWNVKMNQCINFWNSIKKNDINSKMILHQGDHIHMYNHESSPILEILHKWLDFHLYGIENSIIQKLPNVLVQNNLDQNLWNQDDYFGDNHKYLKFPITYKESNTKSFTDDISKSSFKLDNKNSDIEGNKNWQSELVLTDSELLKNKVVFDYDLKEIKKFRISGVIQISFEAALNKNTGILSAMLVDYGKDKRYSLKTETVAKNKLKWGINTPIGDIVRFQREKFESDYRIISRGWMNAQNINNNYSKLELEENKFYKFSFNMIPTDYEVKEGHKLRLIIYGTDPEFTVRRTVPTKILIKLNTIDVKIPYK